MAIFDLFSKRQKKLRGEVPDVFIYDKFSKQFRVQVVHIVKDAFGIDHYNCSYADHAYKIVHETLCREYGIFTLKNHARSDQEAIFDYFLSCEDYEQTLDIVELCFKVMDIFCRKSEYEWSTDRKITPDNAIEELNGRFKEHGIGYQFESRELIRVDSTYMHSEAILPALSLLRGNIFKGANEEFLKAHEHYRHGRNKEAISEALKAFESVMKAICENRKWTYKENDTAKSLINICINNNLIPSDLQSQFTALRSVLESGLPTVRNKHGGHGQGPEKTIVPDYLAQYSLNIAASNILLLIEADKNNS